MYCIVVTGTNGEHKSYYLEALSAETSEMFKKWCTAEGNNRRRVQLDLKVGLEPFLDKSFASMMVFCCFAVSV